MATRPPSVDLLRPFQLERSHIRGRFVRLAGTIDRALEAHDYPAPVSRLLGELMVLAGGLAGGLKFDGQFSLQIRGEGPIRLMVADCTNDGRMRGYASFDREQVEEADAEDSGALLGSGLLALTVDQTASGGDTYQGIVELEGKSLADSMLTYFRRSEQVQTGIRVALGRDPQTGNWCGGAIILQALPPSTPEERRARQDDWLEAMLLLQTASDGELTDPALEPDVLLFRLFHETGVRVFEPMRLAHACSCDEDRVERMLLSFPEDDIEEMRLEDGSIDVTCQFCGRRYHFGIERLAELLRGRRH
jgi:molecular chaperone Hsp33